MLRKKNCREFSFLYCNSWYSHREKQKFELSERQLGQSKTKSLVKPSWSGKNDSFKYILGIFIKFTIE